jgi:hypothetical protein|tara:strand:- start:258 stop:446 length:189 start_codon:yes stop_codon:yes gene_type:complete
VAAEAAKAALKEQGIVSPPAPSAAAAAGADAAPVEDEEASLVQKIRAALPKSLGKVFGSTSK